MIVSQIQFKLGQARDNIQAALDVFTPEGGPNIGPDVDYPDVTERKIDDLNNAIAAVTASIVS